MIQDQGIEDKGISNYYYNVLFLCRSVKPNVREPKKLEYVYRGLKASLLEKNLSSKA